MSEAPRPETYVAWPEARPMLGGISRTTAWKARSKDGCRLPRSSAPGRRAYALSEIMAWQAARNQPPKEAA